MRLLNLQAVLAAVDVDQSSDAALDSATRLAKAAGARLHVVHVLPPTHHEGTRAKSLDKATASVWRALQRANITADDAKVHLIPGSPADTISSLADRLDVDVIVLGPHRSEKRAVARAQPLGSTAQAVLGEASVPVLVTPVPLRLPLERVIVPIDMSETARGALLVAASWASALRVGPECTTPTALTALHVAPAPATTVNGDPAQAVQGEIERLGGAVGHWSGLDVRAMAQRHGNVVETIVRFAADQQADLAVLGSRGLGLDEAERLGSVSAAVVARLEIPMLLVPPAVWRAHAAAA